MFRTSIRNKLMGLLLAATIIPILISMVVSDMYIKKTVTDKSIVENRTMLSLGKNNVLNYMETINKVSLDAYKNLNTPNSLYAIIERGASSRLNVETFEQNNQMQIYGHLLNMYQSIKGIHQIHLQINGPDKLSYLMYRGFFRGGPVSGLDWPAGHADDPQPFVEATHPSQHYELDWSHNIDEQSVFTLRRPIIRTPSDEVIGYLSLDVKSAELTELCRSLASSKEETLYLLDRQRNLICSANANTGAGAGASASTGAGASASTGAGASASTGAGASASASAGGSAQRGSPLNSAWADNVLASPAPSGYIKWEDASFSGIVIYDSLQTNYMDWVIVKQLPYSYLYENARTIRTINSTIIALFLIVVVIATLLVSLQFTKPIKRLISHINKVQTGNLDVAVPVQGRDEIGTLARRFNSMIATINDLINREYKLELANKNNQLKAMQAQINPHFLNNALQSIGTLALQSQAPKVYSLINSLGKMMRYNMSTRDAIVPFEAELSHVKAFLDLQQQRFSDQLGVAFEIDPQTLGVLVPKMLLQPLVENYFTHGYEPHGGAGRIRIRSSALPDGRLEVLVEDNGIGMEPEPLRELQKRLARPASHFTEEQEHIGLSNVAMRLKLYFDETASLAVDSPPTGGFRVVINIPMQGGLSGGTGSGQADKTGRPDE